MAELKSYPDWTFDENIPVEVRKLALECFELERTIDGIWLDGPEVNVVCYVIAAVSLLLLSLYFQPSTSIEFLGFLGLLAAVGIWHTKEKGLPRYKEAKFESNQKSIDLQGFEYFFGHLRKKLTP